MRDPAATQPQTKANSPPQQPLYLWTAAACDEIKPADPELQDIHDIRQKESQEKPQRESIIDRLPEACGLEPDYVS